MKLLVKAVVSVGVLALIVVFVPWHQLRDAAARLPATG